MSEEEWRHFDVEQTFTKSGGAGTGKITITPGQGNRMKFIYGNITIGAVKATPDNLIVHIAQPDSNRKVLLGDQAAAAATEQVNLPALGEAYGPQNEGVIQSGVKIYNTDQFMIELQTMANTETYVFRGTFEIYSEDPTIAAIGGALS